MPQISNADISTLLSPWTGQLTSFALVLARVSGLLSVGPLLGRAILPWQARFGLAIVLSLLIAPLVGSLETTAFDVATIVAAFAAELVLGFLLGCGSLLILGAIPLAGRLLEQQHMLAGEEDDAPLHGSPITCWLTLWGTACFLLSSPINGHLQAVRILAESFRSCPLGSTTELLNTDVLAQLLQQSSQLSLLLVAPAMATLTLTNLSLGLLGAAGLPGVSNSVGNAMRPIVAAIVLAASLSGVQQTIADVVHDGIAITTGISPSSH